MDRRFGSRCGHGNPSPPPRFSLFYTEILFRAMPGWSARVRCARPFHGISRSGFNFKLAVSFISAPSIRSSKFQPLRNGFREGVFPLKGRQCRRSRGNAFLPHRGAAAANLLTVLVRPTDRRGRRRLGRPLPVYV